MLGPLILSAVDLDLPGKPTIVPAAGNERTGPENEGCFHLTTVFPSI